MRLSSVEIDRYLSGSPIRSRARKVQACMLGLGILMVTMYLLNSFEGFISVSAVVALWLGGVLTSLALPSRKTIESNFKLLERYINDDPEALAQLNRSRSGAPLDELSKAVGGRK